MNMWLAIVLVGLGSYAFRLLPLLLGERLRLSKRADATLRHTAVGAMTALMVLGVKRITSDPFSLDTVPIALAFATSGAVALLALHGNSGAVPYALALGVLRIVIG